ncbi:MAG TPA: hypothetical protein VIZ43_26605 [Trebonia sp.]
MTDTRARPAHAGDTAPALADTAKQTRAELRRADERLGAMIHLYQQSPRTLDDAVLAADDQDANVEAAVIGTFVLLQARVYPDDSPLRADRDVWQAFREQRDEFADFHRSALTALESYREILEAYRTVKRSRTPLRRGDLERIKRDKHVHVEERDACLAALREFQGKFSAMLAVLHPVPLP